jgi:hypothetical protein
MINNQSASPWQALSVSPFVPPTGTRIRVSFTWAAAAANINVLLAPNNNYPTGSIVNNVYGAVLAASGLSGSGLGYADMLLETTNIYWGTSGTTITIYALGWKDQVMAN